jgi:hypothetical protein
VRSRVDSLAGKIENPVIPAEKFSIVDLFECSQSTQVLGLTTGDQDPSDCVFIVLNGLEESNIENSGVDKYCITTVVGSEDVSIGKVFHGIVEDQFHGVLVTSSNSASSSLL